MNQNKTKIAVGSTFIIFTLVSLAVAFIMSKNLVTDVSKTRFLLTKDYKVLKDSEFKYSEPQAKKVYQGLCSKCHGVNGKGSASIPGLINSPIVTGKQISLIKVTLHGLQGQIKRQERIYNGVMPGFKKIPHEDLAQVLTYVRQNFGNIRDNVSTLEIIKAKIDYITQQGSYSEDQL